MSVIDKVSIASYGSLWDRLCRARDDTGATAVLRELMGVMYWHRAHEQLAASGSHDRASLFGIISDEDYARCKYLVHVLAYRFAYDPYPPERNDRGNRITRKRGEDFGADSRYKFDCDVCPSADGWQQYDTDRDASYFGIWVNVAKRQTLTYCEGDVTIVDCDDDDRLRAELADMERFYGPIPPVMWACNDIGLVDGKIAPLGITAVAYGSRPIA